MTTTIEFHAIEFATGREAIEDADESERAIRYAGQNLVVDAVDADALEEAGVEFAYLSVHKGIVMTVPVND
jgi:hypothetical protein